MCWAFFAFIAILLIIGLLGSGIGSVLMYIAKPLYSIVLSIAGSNNLCKGGFGDHALTSLPFWIWFMAYLVMTCGIYGGAIIMLRVVWDLLIYGGSGRSGHLDDRNGLFVLGLMWIGAGILAAIILGLLFRYGGSIRDC